MNQLSFDSQSLASLKTQSANSQEGLRKVAQQFEALFWQMMLSSMRDASPETGLFENKESKMYSELLDTQMAQQWASQGQLGMADLLVNQLSQHVAESGAAKLPVDDRAKAIDFLNIMSLPKPANKSPDFLNINPGLKLSIPEAGASIAPRQTTSPTESWNSPEEFVQQLLPHAQRAAENLGVDAKVIIAQACLETGWGQKVPRHANGENSFNVFGIKAGKSWRGDRLAKNSLEYQQHQFKPQKSWFRSYDSLATAVDDYASLLANKPRYAAALESGGNSRAYAQALQAAGYATDPNYANKILRVMQSPTLNNALEAKLNVVNPDVGIS